MFEFNYKRIKSRAITAENFTGEKGRGGMATEGTGKAVSADLRVEVQALGWEYDWKCYRAIAPDITTAAFVYLKKITNVKNYDKQGE